MPYKPMTKEDVSRIQCSQTKNKYDVGPSSFTAHIQGTVAKRENAQKQDNAGQNK